jgi:hypothetical protein
VQDAKAATLMNNVLTDMSNGMKQNPFFRRVASSDI